MLHDIDFKLIETLAGRLKLGYSDGLFGVRCAAGSMRTITLCFGKANRTYAVSDGLLYSLCLAHGLLIHLLFIPADF